MKIIHGDSLIELNKLPENSVDSIVTDPPYGLSFMGKKWDYDVPSIELWKEAIRVLKPGGHLLSFAGSRTYHRMAVNIEDAGFEIRDQIMWVYGSGFPKSHNIEKAINKIDGVEFNEIPASGVGFMNAEGAGGYNTTLNQLIQTGDSTERAQQYEGWGTALKPAHEPIVVARKPLSESTIAENVLLWGTGGINIDGCRVEGAMGKDRAEGKPRIDTDKYGKANSTLNPQSPLGRFPANFIHDGSDEVVGLFPETKSTKSMRGLQHSGRHGGLADIGKNIKEGTDTLRGHDDSGSASRFFYCAKASKKDRNEGLEGFEEMTSKFGNQKNGEDLGNGSVNDKFTTQPAKNFHPTVKPTSLMQYLVRLVTPKGGTVLDPFMGSGSTGKACVLEGFDFIGIELDPEYCKIAEARINHNLSSLDTTIKEKSPTTLR